MSYFVLNGELNKIIDESSHFLFFKPVIPNQVMHMRGKKLMKVYNHNHFEFMDHDLIKKSKDIKTITETDLIKQYSVDGKLYQIDSDLKPNDSNRMYV